MDSIVVYYPQRHEGHYLYAHPERPERVEAVKNGLERIGVWDDDSLISPINPPRELLEKVHTQEYLKILERACRQGQILAAGIKRCRWRVGGH